MQTQRNH